MKILLFIFLFLPFFAFGQYEIIRTDSSELYKLQELESRLELLENATIKKDTLVVFNEGAGGVSPVIVADNFTTIKLAFDSLFSKPYGSIELSARDYAGADIVIPNISGGQYYIRGNGAQVFFGFKSTERTSAKIDQSIYFSGITFKGGSGLDLRWFKNGAVERCTFYGQNLYGIKLFQCRNFLINGNVFGGVIRNVLVEKSDGVQCERNIFSIVLAEYGINIKDSKAAILLNNTLDGPGNPNDFITTNSSPIIDGITYYSARNLIRYTGFSQTANISGIRDFYPGTKIFLSEEIDVSIKDCNYSLSTISDSVLINYQTANSIIVDGTDEWNGYYFGNRTFTAGWLRAVDMDVPWYRMGENKMTFRFEDGNPVITFTDHSVPDVRSVIFLTDTVR